MGKRRPKLVPLELLLSLKKLEVESICNIHLLPYFSNCVARNYRKDFS